MEQRFYWLFGIITILSIIFISGCIQQVPDIKLINANLESPFQLRIGQTGFIESENQLPNRPLGAGYVTQLQNKLKKIKMANVTKLKIKFLNVTEDSRCPSNVQCVWAGRATIAVNILKNGKNLGDFSLTEYGTGVNFDDYSIKLLKVEPYPAMGKIIDISDYSATLIVSQEFCEVGKEYEHNAVNPLACKCPEGYEFETVSMDWGPCPQEGMRDCPASVLKCVRKAKSSQELTFETISKGGYSGHDDRNDYVIKETSEWASLWDTLNSRIIPKPNLPDINFNNEMIIAVFQGSHSTGGYSTEITKIIEKENSIEVFVKETSPSPGSTVTQAFTQPYHIVKTKRVDKEVIFKR